MEIIPLPKINFTVPDFNITQEQQESIRSKLEVNYVANVDNEDFLLLNNYHIPLHTFVCIMYGNNKEGERETYYLRYLGIGQRKPKIRYLVQLYQTNQIMWVKDTHMLRREVFGFMDRTSMLRTTFLFDTNTNCLYRLQKLRYWLELPFIEESLSGLNQLVDRKTKRYQFISQKRKKVICCDLEKRLQNLLESLDGFN